MEAATRPRSRLVEGLAWIAALSAGILVLLPATLELLRAHEAEDATWERAQRAEAEAQRAVHELMWLESDPAADEKLREAENASVRND